MATVVQACVLTFQTRVGTGTQVVSGVVDAQGHAFAGKLFLFLGGFASLNVLPAQTFGNYASIVSGMDNGSVRSGIGYFDTFEFPFTPNKIASVNASVNSSLIDGGANAFFGGDRYRQAYITSVGSGSFTLDYIQNDRNGDYYTVLVLGGDALTIDMVNAILGSTNYSTSQVPLGTISFSSQGFNNTGGITSGTGGGNFRIGWDTRDSGRGLSVHYIRQNAGNSRFQTAEYAISEIDYNSTVVTNQGAIAVWGATTITTGPVPVGPSAVLSGVGVVVKAGSFLQPLSDGQQTVSLGAINPEAIVFAAVGVEPTTEADLTAGTHTLGWATPTASACFWNGENGGDAASMTGMRMLQTGMVLQFATPNGASTTFHSQATIVSVGADGTLVLDWANTDGVARQVLWFAVGGVPPTTPKSTFTTTTAELTPPWALDRFDQKVRVEGPAGSPPPPPFGPKLWVPDGQRWQLCRFDLRSRPEETA